MQGTIVAMAAKMPEVLLTEYGLFREIKHMGKQWMPGHCLGGCGLGTKLGVQPSPVPRAVQEGGEMDCAA